MLENITHCRIKMSKIVSGTKEANDGDDDDDAIASSGILHPMTH